MNEEIEKKVDDHIQKLISEGSLCPDCYRENGEHESFCVFQTSKRLKVFVRLLPMGWLSPSERKKMEDNPKYWYLVTSMSQKRIQVLFPGEGFRIFEFPKTWVKATKTEIEGGRTV